MSFGFTWIQFISFDLAWFHLVSFGFIWFHLVSLDFIWFQLNPGISIDFIWFHLTSRDFTGFHVSSLDFTWCPLISFDFTWFLISFGFTWSRLISISFQFVSFDVTWFHFIPFNPTREKGKARGAKGKREGGRGADHRFGAWISLGIQTARARTHDTKRFPGWTHPPTSDISLCMCIYMQAPCGALVWAVKLWVSAAPWSLVMISGA